MVTVTRNWMDQAAIDGGERAGLTGDERAELVRLRRENRVQGMEIEILKRARSLTPPAPTSPGRTCSQTGSTQPSVVAVLGSGWRWECASQCRSAGRDGAGSW